MSKINLLDVFLWTTRRNKKDVVRMYQSLSPVMQLATGGKMLNFGYWTGSISEPIVAQENLCIEFAKLACLESAETAIDVGSGMAAPAIIWQKKFPDLNLYCVDINFSSLSLGYDGNKSLNSAATALPFSDNTADRIMALESSQHFRPFADFVSESRRVLKPSGILALALPVTLDKASILSLGMLNLTWSSEHYRLDWIRDVLKSGGFEIICEKLIGKSVYIPLADYYLQNRQTLQESILREYPAYVEKILHRSIQKMKKASKEGVIEYVLFKCRLARHDSMIESPAHKNPADIIPQTSAFD